MLTGGTGTASAKQVSNNGSQYGNAWVEHGERVGAPQRDHGDDGGFGATSGTEAHRNGTALRASLGATCTRCGAWRGELGSEPIPDCLAWACGQEPCSVCFVCHLVTVFRAVRRVLHDSGCAWVNLGDSYTSTAPGTRNAPQPKGSVADAEQWANWRPKVPGLGPKQLMMMPARVALALQSDGWVLRSAITWAKKAPMPESVRDRPTNATEMVYLLAKQPNYYWDAEAVRQPQADGTIARFGNGHAPRLLYVPKHDPDGEPNVRSSGAQGVLEGGANLRNFWLLGPEPLKAQHYAAYPTKLVEPCVLAGTSARGQCPACGSPWARETERGYVVSRSSRGTKIGDGRRDPTQRTDVPSASLIRADTTIGWAPTCRCDAGDPVSQTVLDPFAGSGTSLWVARHHGRRAIGIELSPDYAKLCADRLKQGSLGLEVY